MGCSTVSELLFEQFCSDRGLRVERVPEDDTRRPDYRLIIDGTMIVVELKQFDSNNEEIKAEVVFAQEGAANVSAGVPGRRVRRAISDAGPQLKALAKGVYPTLLVLYNNVFMANHAAEYMIKVGMFGLETLLFESPRHSVGPASLVGKKFGPKRMTTPSDNRTISAIGVLKEGGLVSPERSPLSVYHNPYAAVPLPVAMLRQVDGVVQFELTDITSGAFYDWTLVES